jgi:UDP-2,3-diacylglucosamine hydrolase
MKPWLFISDLHLSPERPDIIQRFLRFCDSTAADAGRLYILGDFVEYWIGDDNPVHGLQPAFDALQKLAARGLDICFMAGNRDFLIGNQLADRYDFRIITEPCRVHFDNTPLLLLHGDSLCTDDIDYQQFRQMVRDPRWQKQFLAKPLAERESIAQAMRARSRQANADKEEIIMDVNPQAVVDCMREHGVRLLIHGHTHRPAIHEFDIDGQSCQRVVLPDWYECGGYLMLDDLDNIRLATLAQPIIDH